MKIKKRRRRTGERYTLLKVTAVLLIISVLLTVCFYKMRPLIITYAESAAETIILKSANDAILEVLSEQNVSYGDMVSLSRI